MRSGGTSKNGPFRTRPGEVRSANVNHAGHRRAQANRDAVVVEVVLRLTLVNAAEDELAVLDVVTRDARHPIRLNAVLHAPDAGRKSHGLRCLPEPPSGGKWWFCGTSTRLGEEIRDDGAGRRLEAWITGATGLVGHALVGELCRVRTSEERHGARASVEGRNGAETRGAGGRVRIVWSSSSSGTARRTRSAASVRPWPRREARRRFVRVDFDYPLAFGRAARAAASRKLFVVTAVGADPKSRIFYNRVKGELERALADARIARAPRLSTVASLGERNERRPAERFAMALAKPVGRCCSAFRQKRPIEHERGARHGERRARQRTADRHDLRIRSDRRAWFEIVWRFGCPTASRLA